MVYVLSSLLSVLCSKWNDGVLWVCLCFLSTQWAYKVNTMLYWCCNAVCQCCANVVSYGSCNKSSAWNQSSNCSTQCPSCQIYTVVSALSNVSHTCTNIGHNDNEARVSLICHCSQYWYMKADCILTRRLSKPLDTSPYFYTCGIDSLWQVATRLACRFIRV